MIRINLLPVRQARAQRSSKKLLVLFAVLLVAQIGALVYFQSVKSGELSEIKQQNTTAKKTFEKLKKETASVDDLQTRKAELIAQKSVLDSLVEGQSGPVKMLDELSSILTPLVDPKEKLEAANRQWNPDWDAKRLWIDNFVEKNRVVTINGHARTNEDLAEFLRRLKSSRHFVKADLNVSEAVELTQLNKARVVQFELTALAIYGAADVKKLSRGELGVTKKKKK